ncbi:MAG: SGNH/GDSL hydrolase family protein [Phycisphaerae bacterium]|nr:SGNH/GDSL hydrolase family protein [Phycisphaerae bacterium]
MKQIITASLCVCLGGILAWNAAMTDSSSTSSEETSMSELISQKEPITWLFCGDSITAGMVYTHGWRNFSELFNERLYELGRSGDVVINTARSGANLGDLLGNFDRSVTRFHPDVVFLLFGTNDCVSGPEGVKQFTERYTEVIRRCRQAGASTVILQSTIPVMPLDPIRATQLELGPDKTVTDRDTHNLRMRLTHLPLYVEAVRKISKADKLPLIDHWAVWRKTGTKIGRLTEGFIHPNEYGHRLMAYTIFSAMGMWDDKSPTCRLFVPVEKDMYIQAQ